MIVFLPLVMFEALILWCRNLFGAGKLLLARDEVAEIINSQTTKKDLKTSICTSITQIVVRDVQAKWGNAEHFMEPVSFSIAAPQASDDELVAVLQSVELDSLLTQLPQGLDTVIGQFGWALSGGEAKRLGLARALLTKADILVLDEPTEYLDHDLARRLETRILEMERILIVITHSGWEEASATLQLVR